MSKLPARPNLAKSKKGLDVSAKVAIATLCITIANAGLTAYLTYYSKAEDGRLKELELALPLTKSDAGYPEPLRSAALSKVQSFWQIKPIAEQPGFAESSEKALPPKFTERLIPSSPVYSREPSGGGPRKVKIEIIKRTDTGAPPQRSVLP